MSEQEKKLIPRVTVDLNKNCLRIWKDTIRVLDSPQYVCLLENMDENTIAIAPCEEKMVTSFKMPEGFLENRGKQFRIHSLTYIKSIQHRAPWLKENTILVGNYDEEHNAVVFSLRKDDQTNTQAN